MEPRVKIQVKHLIASLSKYDPELEVVLDTDGWDYCAPEGVTDPFTIVHEDGIWEEYKDDEVHYLVVYN